MSRSKMFGYITGVLGRLGRSVNVAAQHPEKKSQVKDFDSQWVKEYKDMLTEYDLINFLKQTPEQKKIVRKLKFELKLHETSHVSNALSKEKIINLFRKLYD